MADTTQGPHKPRMLLVDDHEVLLSALEVLLEPFFDVVAAGDGASARKQFGSRRFDVAFVDYVLPDMHGVELLRRLRAVQPAARRVLTSGYVVADLLFMLQSGLLHGFLIKPAVFEDIVRICGGAPAEHRYGSL